MSDDRSAPDWLIIGQETWGAMRRRNQLLFEEIARLSPGARILFCEIARRPSEIREWRPPRVRRAAGNVFVARAIRPFPKSLASVSDQLEAAQVRSFARRAGLRDPVIWTQDPHCASLLAYLPGWRLVHDLTDDWTSFESETLARERVQKQVDTLNTRATVTFACSAALVATAAERGFDAQLLPNAVDSGFADQREPHGQLADVPRPRIGYVGTLHDKRVDIALVEQLADARPDWSFVFAGPEMLEPRSRLLLASKPNIHLLGTRPHHEVPSLLASLDAAIVPHHVDEFTRSLDPLKVYEYLAAGLPVVATPVGVADSVREHISFVDDGVSFDAAIEEAISANTPERAASRRDSVRGQTWGSRANEVLDAVEKRGVPGAPVEAIVISYNTADLLRRCLAALGSDYPVTVVDNASRDDSVAVVRSEFPHAALHALERNIGFGPANNIALRESRAETVLLINSDAFVTPGAVDRMLTVMRHNPRVAVIGPRLLNADGTLQPSVWPFPTATRLLIESIGLHRLLRRTPVYDDPYVWGHDAERRVDFVSGACMLIRTEALERTGVFDESFPLYAEETDLQRRLTEDGWQVLFTPEAEVIHLGGASSSHSADRQMKFFAAHRRYLRKHGGSLSWPIAWVALSLGALLRMDWQRLKVVVALATSRGEPK